MKRGARRRGVAGVLRGTGLAVALAAAATLVGCGRVGPPRPPQYVIPRSPESLQVRNVAAGFEITFPRPREYVDGVALDDLGSFEIWRSCEPDPGFIQITDVPVLDRDRFQKQRRFTLTDFDVQLGQVCVYRAVAVTLDDYRSAPVDAAPIRREWPLPEPAPTPSAPPDAPAPPPPPGAAATPSSPSGAPAMPPAPAGATTAPSNAPGATAAPSNAPGATAAPSNAPGATAAPPAPTTPAGPAPAAP